MYKDYFHLTEMPFSIAPDPRFLYMSARHREALAHLLYGVQGEGGILLLTGEVGTGMTGHGLPDAAQRGRTARQHLR